VFLNPGHVRASFAVLFVLLRPGFAAAASTPAGFATVAAYGVATTTGGGGAKPVVVHNALELRDAVEKRDLRDKASRLDIPRVVLVEGDIDLGPLATDTRGTVIKQVGVIQVGFNVTVRGLGANATLHHGTLEVHGAHNVIIQNLRFRDLWEPDPADKYDRLGWDYIRVVNSGQTHSHHVWVDHCDF
jgi:pectate lyase